LADEIVMGGVMYTQQRNIICKIHIVKCDIEDNTRITKSNLKTQMIC